MNRNFLILIDSLKQRISNFQAKTNHRIVDLRRYEAELLINQPELGLLA